MRALVLVLLAVAAPVRAQDSDVPLALQVGQEAPYDGVLLTPLAAARLYKTCEEAKRNAADMEKALEAKGTEPPPFVAVAIAGGLGLVVGVVVTALLVRR